MRGAGEEEDDGAGIRETPEAEEGEDVRTRPLQQTPCRASLNHLKPSPNAWCLAFQTLAED